MVVHVCMCVNPLRQIHHSKKRKNETCRPLDDEDAEQPQPGGANTTALRNQESYIPTDIASPWGDYRPPWPRGQVVKSDSKLLSGDCASPHKPRAHPHPSPLPSPLSPAIPVPACFPPSFAPFLQSSLSPSLLPGGSSSSSHNTKPISGNTPFLGWRNSRSD